MIKRGDVVQLIHNDLNMEDDFWLALNKIEFGKEYTVASVDCWDKEDNAWGVYLKETGPIGFAMERFETAPPTNLENE